MNHPLHSLCPYFAMFPPSFVRDQLFAYSRPKELVFDPFLGRGTTLLEALLNDRQAIGTDINRVAACVSGAKADVPQRAIIDKRIKDLRLECSSKRIDVEPLPPFFQNCFQTKTLQEIVFLRDKLNWRRSKTDRFIAAMMLGALHGESHRSKLCLSNRMPRTISTKPEYSIRWWKQRGLIPPRRNTFEVLEALTSFRFSQEPPIRTGSVRLTDARKASLAYPRYHGEVALVITSPPYLDVTDYAEDQWLRLWFLGGPGHPVARLNVDDRHTRKQEYWTFLNSVWEGCSSLLRDDCTIVVRIGGKLNGDELFQNLFAGLKSSLRGRVVKEHRRSVSEIVKRQTNVFRPGTHGSRQEYDFVFAVC